jgi:hypothetical protein
VDLDPVVVRDVQPELLPLRIDSQMPGKSVQERIDPVDRDLAARLGNLVAEARLEPLPLSRERHLPVVG